MTQEEKLVVLADIFDCDASELKPETKLDQLGWDSMAMLSIIAMMKSQYNKKVTGAELRGFTMVKDILSILG